MRVMQVSYVEPEKLYTKRGLSTDMNISVRTIDKYVIDEELDSKAIPVSNLKLFKGSNVNDKISELLKTDRFVLKSNE